MRQPTKTTKTTKPKSQFSNYNNSLIYSVQSGGRRKKTVAVDRITAELFVQHQVPIMPSYNSIFDLQLAQYLIQDFSQRLKFVTYDRMEGAVSKSGRNLQLSNLRVELFEALFSSWNGFRCLKVFRKGQRRMGFNVYISYEFKDGDKFLDEIPKKYEFVDKFIDGKRVTVQIRHRYEKLELLLDVQTEKIHCIWRQISEEFDGKAWNKSK